MTKEQFDEIIKTLFYRYELNKKLVNITFIDYEKKLDQITYRIKICNQNNIATLGYISMNDEFTIIYKIYDAIKRFAMSILYEY